MDKDRQVVGSAVHSACIHVLRHVRTVDGESGLTGARLSALSVLVFGGPRTIGQLATAEGVRSPTITALVNGLEAEGLVRRVPAAGDDQRQVLVEATAAGTRRMRAAQARRLERLDELLGDLSPRDLATVGRAAALLEGALLRRRDG